MIETEESGHPILKAPAKFELLDGEAYFDSLLKSIPKAKKRIVLAAMVVLWGEKTDAIFAEIDKALARGVRVHILLDNYTKLIFSAPGAPTLRLQLKKTMILLDELKSKGARVHFVGKIKVNPYKGRCHIKITVVDDHSYSFGGINFTDRHLGHRDYMLHAQSAGLADCLEQLVKRIAAQSGALSNREVPLDAGNSILFDGGQPKQSLIYDRACELAASADQIYYVSQMAPSGELARLINHIPAAFYFNQPLAMAMPDRWGQAFDQQRYRTPNDYKRPEYIHAKFILFVLKNGERALLSGSNNFSYRGVAFGTQEIALHSTDTHIWQQLHTFLDHQIKQSRN